MFYDVRLCNLDSQSFGSIILESRVDQSVIIEVASLVAPYHKNKKTSINLTPCRHLFLFTNYSYYSLQIMQIVVSC